MPARQPAEPAKAQDKSSKNLDIDVDEALIDDQHPKDTIQGGPPASSEDVNSPSKRDRETRRGN